MFRNNIFTILLFGSLCASVTAASAEVVFKEDFSGFYANGKDAKMVDANNKALNNRDVIWWQDVGTRLVEISTIATYDTTGGLQSVPLTTNPAISASDIPADRGGNIVNGAFLFQYPIGTDSWKEERFTIEKAVLDGRDGLREIWIQYDQFIPTNHKTIVLSGHWTSKIFFLYAEEANVGRNADEPRLMLTNVHGKTAFNSYIRGDFKHRDELGNDVYTGFGGGDATIDRAVDLGKWQRRTLHVKLPTSFTSNNGIIEYWIRHGNGVVKKHIDITNGDFLDKDFQYIRNGYILGWSNPGFDEDTSFLITNFILSESAQHVDKAAIVYVAPPKPPTGVSEIVK